MGEDLGYSLLALAAGFMLGLVIWLSSGSPAPAETAEPRWAGYVDIIARPMGGGVTCYVTKPYIQANAIAMSCLKD